MNPAQELGDQRSSQSEALIPGDLIFIDCEQLWSTNDNSFLYTGPLIVLKVVKVRSPFNSIVTLLSSRGVVTVYGSLLDSSRKRAGDL